MEGAKSAAEAQLFVAWDPYGSRTQTALRLLVKEAVASPGKRLTSRFCKKTCSQVAFKKLDIDGDGEV